MPNKLVSSQYKLYKSCRLSKNGLNCPSSCTGNISSNPSPPPEVPAVDALAVESHRSEIDVPVRTAISKRKVASAPAAPAYKGV